MIVAAGKVFVFPASDAKVTANVSVPAPPSIESRAVKVLLAAVSASTTPENVSFFAPPVRSSAPVARE